MTSDLPRRFYQHTTRFYATAFTARYTFDRVVYFEKQLSRRDALHRGRQIKAWSRKKKVALIQSVNPNWLDLSFEWTDLLCLK